MIPFIKIFNKTVTTYCLMALLGIFVCLYFSYKISQNYKKDDNKLIELLLFSSIGVFVGSHLLYGLTQINIIIKLLNNLYLIKNFKDFIDVFVYIFGGSVFYGGLLGGLLFGFIYIKKNKLELFYCDTAALQIPLFHFFGRIGCFLSGCCYGIESKFGLTYTRAIVESANGVNRFPIQLVEAGYNIILFLILYKLFQKNKFKGNLINVYLFLYPIGRFIFEFFRGDDYRGFIFGLSTSQIISVIIVVFNYLYMKKTKN